MMQNEEKVFGFIRRRGTLGVLTLVLVGIVAFASYRTSYPVTPETEMETEKSAKTVSGTGIAAQQTEQASRQTEGARETSEKSTEKAALVSSSEVEAAKKTGEKETENTKKKDSSKESEAADPVLSGSVISPTVQFSEDDSLSWPAAGSILMDYSMDGTVYFKTLNEYKYNPALIIGSAVGNPVVASAKGIVEDISIDEETGTTLTMNIGNDYQLIYGELKELAVAEGDVVEQGQLLGYISEPTKYYCEEGSNLYFAMKKDGEIVDPCLYLE